MDSDEALQKRHSTRSGGEIISTEALQEEIPLFQQPVPFDIYAWEQILVDLVVTKKKSGGLDPWRGWRTSPDLSVVQFCDIESAAH